MMSLEEKGAHTLELHVLFVLFLGLGELSDGCGDWGAAEVLDLPVSAGGPSCPIISEDIKKVLLCSQECVSKVHLCSWELPCLCISVLHNEVCAILSGIVDRLSILDVWVYIRKVLRCSRILHWRVAPWDAVGRVVIQIHLAGIGVISQNVFVKLGYLFVLI